MSSNQGEPLPHLDPTHVADLDVREDIANGVPPLARILATVKQLAPSEILHIRSPFRPTRLIDRLERDGFHWHAESFNAEDWSSWFWRDQVAMASATVPERADTSGADAGVLDLRLLPPPEPMLRVLERIEADPRPFEVLVPFYPEPLIRVLAPMGWGITLLENRSDGVRIRVEAQASTRKDDRSVKR
jgi:hypothetical protein